MLYARIANMAIQPETQTSIQPYLYWQYALNNFGQAATDIDDINQCLRLILLTPRGSVPHRPDFAVGIYDYLDRPINQVRNQIIEDVTRAIQKFEPRIILTSVRLMPPEGIERLRLRIEFIVRVNNLESFVILPI